MNTWNALAEKAVDWLVSTSWQAAVLAILVVVVQLGFRGILSARWRYLLWLLVVGRLLIPSLPESPTSLYRYIPASPVVASHDGRIIPPAVTPQPMAVPEAVVPLPATEMPVAPPFTPTPMSAKGVLLVAWLIGFLALAISLVVRNLRFRRMVFAGCRPTTKEVRELAEELARAMGVARRFELLEAESLETPAVVGVFSPKLLLPRNFSTRLSHEELALIFRHELAHLRRGDLWINLLVCILQIVHWFNPVLWWAFGRMRHDRELATDALALRFTNESREAYGETLVKIAAGNRPGTSLDPAIGILENHRRIRQRVEQIARLKPNAYAWSALGAALLVVIALLALTKAPALGTSRGDTKSGSGGQPTQAPVSRTDRFGRPTVDVTITPVPPAGIEWTKMAIETQWGAMDGTVSADGKSFQVQMIAGGTILRTVCRTASGRLYFSDCENFQLTDKQVASGQSVQVNFPTTLPGFDFKGQLDASVPRPVKDGLAIAFVSSGMPAPNIYSWLMWKKSAPIHADGTFEITNLPPPTAAISTDDGAGPLLLIVTCDGYVSHDPNASKFEYAEGSQTLIPPIAVPFTVRMEPTGSARVRVLDPDGKPLARALVQFSPNQTFRNENNLWYSSFLNSTWDDEKDLFHEQEPLQLKPDETLSYQKSLAKLQAVTNQDGFAEISGLPAGLVPYTVEKTPYDMSYRLRLAGSSPKYAQDAIVTINAGSETTSEVRLIPKIEPIRIANSTSPDGKYVLSVESSRQGRLSGPGPQCIALRDAKTGELKSSTFLPSNEQNKVDLVYPHDRLLVKWDASSSCFFFSVWHTDHFDVLGARLSFQDNQLGLACSDLSEGMNGKVISCKLIGKGTLHVQVLRATGKTDDFYWSMSSKDQFEGSSEPL